MTSKEFRQKMLDFARADMGQGEEGMNNWGPYVRSLLKPFGIDFPASWCAALMWSCINKTITETEGDTLKGDGDYNNLYKLKTPSALDMYNKAKALGWVLPDGAFPEPGDIMIIKRIVLDKDGKPIPWVAHAAIVERVKLVRLVGQAFENYFYAIEGNVGKFPAKLQQAIYDWPVRNLVGFIRLLG